MSARCIVEQRMGRGGKKREKTIIDTEKRRGEDGGREGNEEHQRRT